MPQLCHMVWTTSNAFYAFDATNHEKEPSSTFEIAWLTELV